jgi:uncharacterized cupredoxin-like copper-binding protein/mono/diheme cytochrome c family protein
VGAVQKLATVVIVGLVALSTLLVIYLADEPNRMAAEVVEKDDVAIERGINTFVQNCVVCHGPAGEGYSEPGAEGTGRIGMPLGGDTEQGRAATELNQSEDPVTRQQRHDLIVKTINNGRGLMPAFGTGAEGGALLNQEQISELALMIQNVDWDLVYNTAIEASGGYPTFPPPPASAAQTRPTPAPAPAGGGENAGEAAASDQFTIESHDIFFQPAEIDIPSDTEVTILLPNLGASPHNFSIDALDVSVDIAPGETKEVTITAPEGQYEYYCNVPGHKEAGMVGTLISRPMTSADTAATSEENAAADADEAAQEAASEAPAAAAEQVVTAFDIYFEPKEVTIPAHTDVTFTLPNDGAAPHDFSIDELGIAVSLPPGETQQVVINAPPGTYEFYCNVPGHKEAGMVGTLIVEEGGGQAAAPAADAETDETAPAEEEAAPAPAEQAAAEPVEIVSHDIYFEPKEVTIPANTDVTVSLPNAGAAPHNFSVDDLGISVDIAPGATEQVVINAPPGTYEFYCNIPGHKEAGMVGTLTVSSEGGGQEATSAQPAASSATEAAPAESAAQEAAPAAGAASAEPVEVVSHDIYFELKEVTIPANTDVTFTLPNQGAAPHNFSVDELGISVDIAPGATEEVVVNAPPGTYEFHCNVPGHKEAGMVGTLTVT